MHKIVLNEDIKPLSEFRANVSSFINQIHKTKRPIVLTQHGKSTAVILDVLEYESIIDRLELADDIKTAEKQISEGHGIGHPAAKKRLLQKYSK